MLASVNTTDLDFWPLAMGLMGGLAVFLYGMEKMTDSLKALAGDGMRNILSKLTRNRFLAAFTGAFVTAVIQSSSVTTVLVVGFISAGLMSLSQSVGVIMGANIGTTITAQIIAFKVTEYALLLIALGFAGTLFNKRTAVRLTGMMLFGLGMIFLGMDLMSQATNPLRSYEPFIELMGSMANPFLGILVGAAFTALVQSSSATTGIVIVLASQGFITLEAGIALSLGANVGTCVTALLSAIGKPRTALQAAMVHVLFNLLGAIIWVPLIPYLADLVRELSPASEGLTGVEKLAAEVPRQIANAHTVFNVGSTVVFIWFTGLFAKVIEKLFPEKPKPGDVATVVPQYLEEVYLDTPSLALDRLRLEIGHLGELTSSLIRDLVEPHSKLETVGRTMTGIESLHQDILYFFNRIDVDVMEPHDLRERDLLLESANQIFAIADTVSSDVSALRTKWSNYEYSSSKGTSEKISKFVKDTLEQLATTIACIRDNDPKAARRVVKAKGELRREAEEIRLHLGERMTKLDRNSLVKYRLELSFVEVFQQISNLARRAAKAVIEMHKGREHLADPRSSSHEEREHP